MPISFACTCGKMLRVNDELAGRRVRCPSCQSEVQVPDDNVEAILLAEDLPASESPRRSRLQADDKDEEMRAQPAATSGKATASLVLGLLSFLCSIFSGIPAIIMGILGLRDINRARGQLQGQGLAIGGILTGSLGLACSVPLLVGLLLPAVQKVREAAARTQDANNLKQISLAMHNYQDAMGRCVPSAITDARGRPLLSWRVELLPYLEQDVLYRQFKRDEPWDSPTNKPLLTQMPRVYAKPNYPESLARGLTYYCVFVGPGAAFEPGKTLRFSPQDFPDGLSNTLLITESSYGVPWTRANDLDYAPDRPVPPLGTADATGFNVALADGSVRFIRKDISETALRALITRNGNEPPGRDW